jgi:hypothetical protein
MDRIKDDEKGCLFGRFVYNVTRKVIISGRQESVQRGKVNHAYRYTV